MKVDGQVYWVKVNSDQTVELNGQVRQFTCQYKGTPTEDCWNIIVW